MPSNEERREVAARLRKRAANYDGETEAWNELAEAAFGWVCGFEHSDLFEYLADLVEPEERTCRNSYDGREFHCSGCGTQWHLLTREDALCEWEHVRTPTFCPKCGARVKEGQ